MFTRPSRLRCLRTLRISSTSQFYSRTVFGFGDHFTTSLSSVPEGRVRTNLDCPAEQHHVAFALDVEGVLLKGRVPMPGAAEALSKLFTEDGKSQIVPFVLMSNGGGFTEKERAELLTQKFALPFQETNIILSHTPMKNLVHQFGDQLVLVVGREGVKNVLYSYGFQKLITTEEYGSLHPQLYPFKTYPQPSHEVEQWRDTTLAAVLVLTFPLTWGEDLQIITDVLRTNGFPFGPDVNEDAPQLPIFFSNPDFCWEDRYKYPRFSQGAFYRCLQLMYKEITGKDLIATHYGKPGAVTYLYASNMLRDQCTVMGLPRDLTRIYAIGDNPLSDVKGANIAGKPWYSVLIESQLPSDGVIWSKPKEVYPDVLAALNAICQRHPPLLQRRLVYANGNQ